jgi:Zn-dependent protease
LAPVNLVSHRRLSLEPEIIETVFDRSGGALTVLSVERKRVVERNRPSCFRSQLEDLNGVAHPLGKDSFHEHTFVADGDGTLATFTWQMQTGSLWHMFQVWRILNKMANRDQAYLATGAVPKPVSAWRSTPMIMSLLAVAASVMVMGWIAGLLLSAMILIHEIGHWLAMRMNGNRSARIMLIPLFGGVAVQDGQHKSQFSDAFCSLMGAGFSAFVCAGLLFGYHIVDGGPLHNAIAVGAETAPHLEWRIILIIGAAAMGLFNLLQLIPVMPLDGGQILRSVLQSIGVPKVGRILMLLCGFALAWGIWSGGYLLIILALIGVLVSYHVDAPAVTVPPMSRPEITSILAGLVATITILILPCTEIIGARSQPLIEELDDADAESGTTMVPPRFTVAGSRYFSTAERTQVYGNRAGGGRVDMRMWGDAQSPGVFAWVKTTDQEGTGMARKTRRQLRMDTAEMFEFYDTEPDFAVAGPAETIEGPYGVMDTVTFTAKTESTDKSCRAFHGFAGKGKAYIAGALCREGQAPVALADVRCLMSTLVIDGIVPVEEIPSRHCSAMAMRH